MIVGCKTRLLIHHLPHHNKKVTMLTGFLRTRTATIRAPRVLECARWTSTAAKPRVLMLDPINLAKAELATLEKEATLIVSCGGRPSLNITAPQEL